MFRKVLFWCHLVAGVCGGLVILIMSATGVLLTYERQLLAWAETKDYVIPAPQSGEAPLMPEAIVARMKAVRPDVTPSGITIRADRSAPASVSFGPRAVQVHPYNGAILGEGAPRLRAFFRAVTDWHRWLAFEGESRLTGRAITGACNLAFLFVVASGMFLWWPRSVSWTHVRAVVLFRGGLRGKARDFNWHNVIGFWSALPLFIVVLGGVVISYPWASDLVFRAAGEEPPPRQRPGVPGGGPAPQRQAEGSSPGPAQGRGQGGSPTTAEAREVFVDGLDRAFVAAAQREPAWRTISVRVPTAALQPASLTIDSGTGGQPQKRATLEVDRMTGEVVRWEPFSAQSPGRRVRSWLRFVHTGEVYGLVGQTIAGAVSLGGVLLVWTGMSLSLRRFLAWRKRGTGHASRQAA